MRDGLPMRLNFELCLCVWSLGGWVHRKELQSNKTRKMRVPNGLNTARPIIVNEVGWSTGIDQVPDRTLLLTLNDMGITRGGA